MNRKATGIDALDRKILQGLMSDGRISWAQLAVKVGLSGPSVTERVRKLERLGVIESYGVRLRPEALGYRLLAFVSVGLSDPADHDRLLEWVRAEPAVQECHIIAGEYDYLLKIRCRDTATLERILREDVRAMTGVARTNTAIVMVTEKEANVVPLPDS
jgi:Lrp/AsnC family leucine-responsive transcriptional regulator